MSSEQEEGSGGNRSPQSFGIAAADNVTGRPDDSELARLLDGVKEFILRYAVLDDQQADVVALWVLHTHVLAATDITPYLSISSAEKRSGKTTLLELLELIVANPWLTGSVSAATLARKVDEHPPATLLLDESDTAFKGDGEYAEALRGILNSGHRRGGKYSRCVGANGTNLSVVDFSTFGAKAIAGINKLPDTVADRSIQIRMKRKAPGENVAKFRRREVAENVEPLQRQTAAWVELVDVNDLAEARPDVPDELNDRAADGYEPLVAIADMAGGLWPQRARAAALVLSAEEPEEVSTGIQLLTDTRAIWLAVDDANIFTADLIQALAEFGESPWGEWWWDGTAPRPSSERRLAKLLRLYGIRSQTVRVGDSTAKGYRWADFEDAWKRLLPPFPQMPSQASHPSQPAWLGKPDVTDVTDVTASERQALADGIEREFTSS